jgi:hypothetical protein
VGVKSQLKTNPTWARLGDLQRRIAAAMPFADEGERTLLRAANAHQWLDELTPDEGRALVAAERRATPEG